MRNGITHSHILETEGEGWGATVRGHHQLLGETQVCPRLQLRFQNTVTFLGSESFLMKEQLSFNKESKASHWGKHSPSEELGQVKSERWQRNGGILDTGNEIWKSPVWAGTQHIPGFWEAAGSPRIKGKVAGRSWRCKYWWMKGGLTGQTLPRTRTRSVSHLVSTFVSGPCGPATQPCALLFTAISGSEAHGAVSLGIKADRWGSRVLGICIQVSCWVRPADPWPLPLAKEENWTPVNGGYSFWDNNQCSFFPSTFSFTFKQPRALWSFP